MGVDAEMVFTMTTTPTVARLREIQYALMEKVGREIFFTETWEHGYDGPKVPQMFLSPWDSDRHCGFDGPDIEALNLIHVSLFCRYYGEGYERGPALKLAAIMLVLLGQPDVEEVYYGGDSSGIAGEPYTRERVHALIDYYCHFGREPYMRYELPAASRIMPKRGEGPTPACSYCHVPMHRSGFGGAYASFFCPGCGESLKLRDDDFRNWVNGITDVATVPRFNGPAQPEDKEIF